MNQEKRSIGKFVTWCVVLVLGLVPIIKGESAKIRLDRSADKWTRQNKDLLSVEQMRADLNLLHKILLESHPNLYRAISEEKSENAWRNIYKRIKKPLSVMQFLNLLNPLLGIYNDGHTYLEMPFESNELKDYVAAGNLFFPFRVWGKNDRLYVTESFGKTHLPPGTEIVTVSGAKVKNINRDLINATAGDSSAAKSVLVTRLFGLLFWQRSQRANEYKMTVRRPAQKKLETVSAKGISFEKFKEYSFSDPAARFYELTPQIAVLEINFMQSDDAVKQQIDDAFRQIRQNNYSSLVIDIRRNGGGNSIVADWVFAYLTAKPYRHSDIKEVRLSPYLIEKNKFFRQWTTKLKETNAVKGDKIILESQNDKAAARRDWLYDGRVYLLTSPRTYSSGFMMAETFKCYGFGTLIGESPGSYRNLTGELMNFRLPNSKLIGYVSTSQYFPPCYQKAKTDFLAPDIKIEQAYKDLVKGKDTVLEYIKSR